MTQFAGIDYSMSSPSVCLWDGQVAVFHYLTSTKKYEGSRQFGNGWQMTGHPMRSYANDQQRFDQISDWAISCVHQSSPDLVAIEGYAMGAKGLVFNIAENTGLLKYKLWKANYKFVTPAPSAVKKMATGKGNANKETMQESFIQETSIDIKGLLGMTPSSWNPSSDLIDSWYMAKWAEVNAA